MVTSEVGGSKSFTLLAIGRYIANSTTIKVAAFVTGIGILAFVFFNAAVLGTGVIVSLSITGAVLTLAASIALVFSRCSLNRKASIPQKENIAPPFPVPTGQQANQPTTKDVAAEVNSKSLREQQGFEKWQAEVRASLEDQKDKKQCLRDLEQYAPGSPDKRKKWDLFLKSCSTLGQLHRLKDFLQEFSWHGGSACWIFFHFEGDQSPRIEDIMEEARRQTKYSKIHKNLFKRLICILHKGEIADPNFPENDAGTKETRDRLLEFALRGIIEKHGWTLADFMQSAGEIDGGRIVREYLTEKGLMSMISEGILTELSVERYERRGYIEHLLPFVSKELQEKVRTAEIRKAALKDLASLGRVLEESQKKKWERFIESCHEKSPEDLSRLSETLQQLFDLDIFPYWFSIRFARDPSPPQIEALVGETRRMDKSTEGWFVRVIGFLHDKDIVAKNMQDAVGEEKIQLKATRDRLLDFAWNHFMQTGKMLQFMGGEILQCNERKKLPFGNNISDCPLFGDYFAEKRFEEIKTGVLGELDGTKDTDHFRIFQCFVTQSEIEGAIRHNLSSKQTINPLYFYYYPETKSAFSGLSQEIHSAYCKKWKLKENFLELPYYKWGCDSPN